MNDDDVRYTFDAVDESKTGEITLEQFYHLFLGLGFATTRLEKTDLRRMVTRVLQRGGQHAPPGDSVPYVTLDTVFKVLDQEIKVRQ